MFQRLAKRIGSGLAAFGRVAPTLLRDLAGLAGAGLVSYGAWLVHPAAGFITGGALLLVGVVLLSAKSAG